MNEIIMTWPKWVLITWYTLGYLAVLAAIGKPRAPLSPVKAAVTFAVSLLVCALVVIA